MSPVSRKYDRHADFLRKTHAQFARLRRSRGKEHDSPDFTNTSVGEVDFSRPAVEAAINHTHQSSNRKQGSQERVASAAPIAFSPNSKSQRTKMNFYDFDDSSIKRNELELS